MLSSHLCLHLPSGLFPSSFPTIFLYTPLHSPICTTCPAHPILLDLITRTILGEEYRSRSYSLCSFLHSHYLVPLRPKYFPQQPFLKHPQPTSSLIVSDQVSHPYKTTGKIIVLYIRIFKFLDSKLEDKRFRTE